MRILNNKDRYTKDLSGYYLEEIQNCLSSLEKYCNVYETVVLMASFTEELKIFTNRVYTRPKTPSIRHLFSANSYDDNTKLKEDLLILLDNYKVICEALKDYPLWKEKFESESSKLFAYNNTIFDTPDIYELINQQKIFK